MPPDTPVPTTRESAAFDGFRFGRGLPGGDACCQKPVGCTNVGPGCLFRNHRWKQENIPKPEPAYRLLFGYRHVSGVPRCICSDPGDYLSMEQSTSDPLDVLFRCWCGRTITARMDSPAELVEFLAKNGAAA